MRNLALRLLPRRRFPIAVRYGAALAMVAAAFLSKMALHEELRLYPVLFYIPVVFLTSLLFDRGTGFFATIVSAVAVLFSFFEPRDSVGIAPHQIIPLALFVLIGFAISAIVESLREAITALEQAERRKALLLDELAHRSKNDVMMVASALRLQASSETRPEVKAALQAAVGRAEVVISAQNRLREREDAAAVELSGYLESLCGALGTMLRDLRPIGVVVRAERIELPSQQAVLVGLIANELVTNALKYAFPEGRGGTVRVELNEEDGKLLLAVADDGVGCPAALTEGTGYRLVRMLAAGMKGQVVRRPSEVGCRVEVRLSPDR